MNTMNNNSLPDLIMRSKPQFALAIGGSTPAQRQERAERFTRICLTAMRQTPKLAQCEPASILGAMMTCAQLNLEPNTPQGLAYLIPYGRECQFQVGYKGLMQLMYRSGAIASFNADVVYRQEVEQGLFEYESGISPRIIHKIDLLNPEARTGKPEDVIAAYAAVVLKTGEPIVRLVTKMEIDQARALNRGNSPAWRDHYAAMAIKTAIKRLSAWLPVTKVADAFAAEEATATAAEAVVEQEKKPTPAATVDAINAMLAEEEKPAVKKAEEPAKEEPAAVEPAGEKPAEQPAQKAEPAPQVQGEKIKCPDSGKMVDDVADCPNCPHRQGCPQWD
nr:MAG TPA: RecT protein [Caudoviricetes sp.]